MYDGNSLSLQVYILPTSQDGLSNALDMDSVPCRGSSKTLGEGEVLFSYTGRLRRQMDLRLLRYSASIDVLPFSVSTLDSQICMSFTRTRLYG